jgi:hypothetical protein
VGPSLRWATAKVERQSRGSSDWSDKVSVGAGTKGDEETPLDAE